MPFLCLPQGSFSISGAQRFGGPVPAATQILILSPPAADAPTAGLSRPNWNLESTGALAYTRKTVGKGLAP
jgi:hypothetical protein